MTRTLRNTSMLIKMDVETRGLREANREIEQTRRSMELLERAARGASGRIDDTTESLRDLDRASRDSSDSTEDNTRSTNRNEDAQDDLTDSLAERERRTRRVRDEQDDLTESTRRNREELTGARRRVAEWSDSMTASGRQLRNLGSTVQNTGEKFSAFGQEVTASMRDVTLAVGAGVGYAVKQAADFEQAMRDVESLMSASEWQRSGDKLSKMVTQLGTETKYSSKQVAGGLEEVIKAGISTEDILAGGLKDALNLATAGSLDLSKAAEVMSTALNAFTKDTITSTRAADLLAGAANASATSVQEMAFGLSQSAAVSNTVGFMFEETSTALALFAQNGLKGSDAGTSLKTMLLRLSPQTVDARAQMEALGLATHNSAAGYKYLVEKGITPVSRTMPDMQKAFEKLAKQELGSAATKAKLRKETEKLQKQSGYLSSAFFDQEGEVRSMAEVFGLLHDKTKHLSNEQKINAFNIMFGSDAIRAAAIAADQGAKGYKEMNEAMQGVTAAEVAAKRMDTLYGSLEKLKSASNTLATDFGTALTPTVRGLADSVTDLANWFNSLDQSTKESAAKWTLITLAGAAAVTAFGLVSIAIGGTVTGVGALIGAFGTLKSGIGRLSGWLVGTRTLFDTETSAIDRNTDALRRNNRERNNGGDGGGAGGNGGGRRDNDRRNDRDNDLDDIIVDPDDNRNDEEADRRRRERRERHDRRRRRIRTTRALSKVGKIVPYAGAAIAATSFIGADSSELGGITGEIGGSLAGGAAGAALGASIGSVIPGVGTVLGGALGGIIGTVAGSSAGEKLGASLQKHWPTITKNFDNFTKKHPILSEAIINSNPITSLAVNSYRASKVIKKAFEDPLPATIEFGKGVSKAASQAINSYMSLESKTKVQLSLLAMNGEKYSKSARDSITKNFNSMVVLVEDSFKKTKASTGKNLSILAESGLISDKDKKDIEKNQKKRQEEQLKAVRDSSAKMISINKKAYEDQKKETKKAEDEINKIKKKAADENRILSKTDKERIKKIETEAANARKRIAKNTAKDIAKETEKQRKNVVASLSKSEKQQLLILGRLQDESEKISARQAADIVKNAEKARKGAVKAANEKFNKVKQAADEEYYVTGTIGKEQHEKIVKEAEKTRDESVALANDMKVKIVETAKKQAEGHIKEVDWETGQILSKWDNFKVSLAKIRNNVTNGINKVLEFFNLGTIPEWKPAGYSNSTSAKTKVASNARGTNYHPGGASVVGEEGPELAYTPYGDAWIVGQNGAEIVDLPRGAKVLTASQTSQMMSGGLKGAMPGYASGNGGTIKEALSTVVDKGKDIAGAAVNKTKEVAGSALNKAGEITDGVMSFLTDPASAIKKLLAENPLSKTVDIGGIGAASLEKIKNGAVDFLKDKIGNFGFGFGSTGGVGISGGAAAWSKMIIAAAAQMQVALSGTELQGIIAQIQRESGGNEKITQSPKVVDINTLRGNPARGLLQYIPQTFNAYKVKGFGDIYNGYHQLLAFFNNSTWRRDLPYGRRGWGPRGTRRFKNGGQVNQNDQVLVGEEGPELVDLPFGSYVNNHRKTNELLKKKDAPNINFNPVINITLQGGNGETNEAAIQRAVNAALEKAFKDFRSIINSGVAY
ncbi:phage tail tape measure protein [Metabacillus fastidiosus]|uniref:phage tail tape measure protein n=1 Tax=Metabacillus fastidiosus TaxID=1458 RepID=UPI002E1AC236|nr:phage tail tape measure protein [Metabacillus fastidiosus]MED4455901.1 phage tail tape measure protein [Metabacillus fastidiosus]